MLSAPDGDRLDRALDGVGFMLSIDPYLNETTRHADVILPPPPPSQSAHFDFALTNLAVRNNARYSPPVLPLDGRPDEAEILSRIALILYGVGVDADPALVDEQVIATTLAKETADPNSPVAGRPVDELTAMLAAGPGYERRLDMMLRLGPYGDAFGAEARRADPGAAQGRPRTASTSARCGRGFAEVLRTPSGKVELAPEPLVADAARLRACAGPRRRRLRPDRPTAPALQQQLDAQPARAGGRHEPLHAADAPRRRGRTRPHRHRASVKGPGGELVAPVELTDRHAARRGVAAARLGSRPRRHAPRVAAGQPGVNVNQLNDGTSARPAVGHRCAQRHPGRYRSRGLTSVSSQITVTEKPTVC